MRRHGVTSHIVERPEVYVEDATTICARFAFQSRVHARGRAKLPVPVARTELAPGHQGGHVFEGEGFARVNSDLREASRTLDVRLGWGFGPQHGRGTVRVRMYTCAHVLVWTCLRACACGFAGACGNLRKSRGAESRERICLTCVSVAPSANSTEATPG